MCGKMMPDAPHCTLRVELRGKQAFWGAGVATLLHEIQAKHSLRAAAQGMNISYTKAWKIVHEAEQGLGFALLESVTGGTQGGGSRVTDEGRALLEAYDMVVCTVDEVLQDEFNKHIKPLFTR